MPSYDTSQAEELASTTREFGAVDPPGTEGANGIMPAQPARPRARSHAGARLSTPCAVRSESAGSRAVATAIGLDWVQGTLRESCESCCEYRSDSRSFLRDALQPIADQLAIGRFARFVSHCPPGATCNTYAHVMPAAGAKAVETIAWRLGRPGSRAS